MEQENKISLYNFTGTIDAAAGTAIANAGVIATTDFNGQVQRLTPSGFRKTAEVVLSIPARIITAIKLVETNQSKNFCQFSCDFCFENS